jgi:hypothetical protein
MAFYIIENIDQLSQLSFSDCFVKFIPKNNNFHPALTELSLIYIRPINHKKGYIICLDHNESFSIDKIEVTNWLLNNTDKLWVLNKKEALYWVYPLAYKLFDVYLIGENIDNVNIKCIDFYYNNYFNLSNINCLIPISKHYEESELMFTTVLPIIKKHNPTNLQFQFQNFNTVNVFYNIEKNGIKVDKNCFIDCYSDSLKYPEFSLFKGKIYSSYNLNTITSRPSNTYNSINFAALNKTNGERLCYRPNNEYFIEIDIQGYHPRLIGELIGFEFPENRNTYDYLGELLNVTQEEAKELTFKQLYGGVWNEYSNKLFFKDIIKYIDDLWDTFQYGGVVKTHNKTFIRDKLEKITPHKLFNYAIQSYETSTNIQILEKILSCLENKKTKIVLYTYDAFLFDYSKEDKDLVQQIIKIIKYPVNIKQGKTYHNLTKI